MERIVYRITLDTHKNGIQRTLQGFETADNMARRIAVNLMSNGDTYELPSANVTAVVYVTTPNAEEPSINACTIEDNTIVYDALPIVEEGITEMQIKLIQTSVDGAKSVLAAPRFAVEVTKSGIDDSGAEQTTTFTALEDALARAHGVYDSRLLKIEVGEDCTFRAYYADGTIYENDALSKALYHGNALLSESWAKGGTGSREGEDTDNSKFYSEVSKSASEAASNTAESAQAVLDDALKRSVYTVFSVDYETGELCYLSSYYGFDINEETGQLEVDGGENYTPEQLIGECVDVFIEQKSAEIDDEVENAVSIAKGKNQARVFNSTDDMNTWLADEANKGVCGVGDNLYIVDVGVPDWWVSEVLDEADSDTGFYYKIAVLETQKVDVAEILSELGIRFNKDTGMIQVYHDGAWVDYEQTGLVVLYFYKGGNSFSDVTGGYEKVLIDDNMQYGDATFDLNANGYISATFSNDGIKLQTVNKNIDLTQYNAMEVDYIIECTGTSYASNYAKFSVIAEDGTVIGERQFSNTEMDADPSGTVTVELSGDRQSAYFELLSTFSGTANIKISRIAFIK